MDTGSDAADSAGTFTITTDTSTTFSRTYRVKVSFIECSNPLLPPAGCAQYYVGQGGNVKSLNFDQVGSLSILAWDFYSLKKIKARLIF